MKIRSLLSTLGLTVSLIGFTHTAAALESGVEGGTASADAITGTAWDALAGAFVNIPNTGSVWHCTATCSAEAERTNGNTIGTFVIRRNGATQPVTRSFSLNVRVLEVSTTVFMPNLSAGAHTMQCAARKNSSGSANYRINDSSISVNCSDFRL